MTLEQMIQEVVVIEQQLGSLLNEEGKIAIAQARKDLLELRNTAGRPGRQRRKGKVPWSFRIPPGTPLCFSSTSISAAVRHRLTIDLFCSISEPEDGIPLGEHNLVIRVWTYDPSLWYRESFDAPGLRLRIQETGGRRVMQRVHLDHASPGQEGPRFHFQMGGTQHGYEFCWFPENLKLPRFPHYPLALITACEFIVLTFFPGDYERVAGEATWIGAVQRAQVAYIKPYFRRLLSLPQSPVLPRSVLNHLWNSRVP
jgi:hypothetical protein